MSSAAPTSRSASCPSRATLRRSSSASPGLPTFTIDGADLFDTVAVAGTLACRNYPTPAGLAGVPEVSDLVAALTKKVTA